MENEEKNDIYCKRDDNWYGMLFAVVLGATMAMAFDSWGVGIGVGVALGVAFARPCCDGRDD